VEVSVSPFSLGDDRGGCEKVGVRLGRVSRSSTKKNETVFGEQEVRPSLDVPLLVSVTRLTLSWLHGLGHPWKCPPNRFPEVEVVSVVGSVLLLELQWKVLHC